MKLRYLYLVLALIGLVLPYSQYLPYVATYGFQASDLWTMLWVNPITSFYGFDLLGAAVCALLFMVIEGRRIQLPYWWLGILCTCGIGMAVGLPLFLYLRDRHLEVSNRLALSSKV